MTHPQVKLDEAFWFQEGPGVRKWQFTDYGIKLLNVGNILKTGIIDLAKTDRHLAVDEVQERYSHFLADAGDLVIASSGISIEDDKLLRTRGAFVEEEHLPLCMNTSTIRFKAIDGFSDLGFLKHWLQSREFRVQITREVTGIAQKNFGPSHLKRLHVGLPPLAEQKRIAGILDAADALRVKRRESLAQLDTLLQSTFLDMFGDPVTNPMGWKPTRLGDIAINVTDGKHGDCRPDPGSGYFFVSVKDIKDGEIEYANAREIWIEDFEEVHRRTQLEPLDVLITNTGTIGRTAVIREHANVAKTTFQKSVAIVKPRLDLIDSFYLKSALDFNVGHLSRTSTGSSQKNLLLGQIRSFQIPLPPLDVQHRFAAIVGSIEQQKASQRAHLDELDTLFASLQSRAFQGDL